MRRPKGWGGSCSPSPAGAEVDERARYAAPFETEPPEVVLVSVAVQLLLEAALALASGQDDASRSIACTWGVCSAEVPQPFQARAGDRDRYQDLVNDALARMSRRPSRPFLGPSPGVLHDRDGGCTEFGAIGGRAGAQLE